MIEKIGMKDEFEVCEGFMGVRSIEQVLQHMENKYLRDSVGAQFDAVFVDEASDIRHKIPSHFHDICTFVRKEYISDMLRTPEYFPVLFTSKKACVNSALFCQKCLIFLTEKYGSRLNIYEHSPVQEIRSIPEQKNEIKGENFVIKVDDVVLCTNGFENFHIIDLHQNNALETDHMFHKNVSGLVGYMAGYTIPWQKPSAISYFPDTEKTDWQSEKYFYVTCRTYTPEKSLLCTGGPDSLVPHDGHYDANTHDPE